MADPKIDAERQYIKDCKECEEINREDERLKVRLQFKNELESVLNNEWGYYQNNSKRLDMQSKWLFALTIAIISLYLLSIYLLYK